MATQFGIINVEDDYGFATNVERDISAEQETYADSDGNTKGFENYDESETITISATYDSGTPPPNVDDDITLSIDGTSRKYTCTNVKHTEENKAFRKVEITAIRWFGGDHIPA